MVDARMAAGSHEAEVARLREAYAALPPGAPVRLAKRTSNLFRFRDADPKTPKNPRTVKNPRTSAERTAQADRGLDVSAFGHVLCVDPATRTARLYGLALRTARKRFHPSCRMRAMFQTPRKAAIEIANHGKHSRMCW